MGLGACVPPSFGVEQAATDPAAAEVTGLTFSDPTNTYSITAGAFAFHFVVEADVLTTLAAAITDTSALSIGLTDGSGVLEGDYLQIGREVVLCGAPSGGTVPVTRGQLATAAATAASGASVWKVQRQVATTSFPLDFVNSESINDWKLLQPLGGCKLLSVGGSVTNPYGTSEVNFVCLTGGADHGLRLSAGGSKLAVMNPPANTDYSILAGNVAVNVVATTRVVIITLPPEGANKGEQVVVNRAAGSTFDVHVIPGATSGTADTIDGSSSTVEVLTAVSPTWAGWAV